MRLAITGCLLAAVGCGNSGEEFVCSDSRQCQSERDGVPYQGTCEPTRACSFEDPTCASGRRYGSLARDALANQCVPASAPGDDGGTSTMNGQSSVGNDAGSPDPSVGIDGEPLDLGAPQRDLREPPDLRSSAGPDLSLKSDLATTHDLATAPDLGSSNPDLTSAASDLSSSTNDLATGSTQDLSTAPDLSTGGGGGCFTAGTPILLADGTERAIERLNPGDRVLSFDVDSGRLLSATVARVIVHHGWFPVLRLDDRLRVTPNHPVFINSKWMPVGAAKIRDRLLRFDVTVSAPSSHELRALESESATDVVFNLALKDGTTYFAAGLLVQVKE